MTKTFGRHLINSGHEMIASNSRGPEILTGLAQNVSALILSAAWLLRRPHSVWVGERMLIGIIQYKIVIESPISHGRPLLAFVIFQSEG